eukprot:jgi/Ulvmu1/7711/UM039_0017.1
MFSMYSPVQASRVTPPLGTFEEFIDSIVMNDEFVPDGDHRGLTDNGNISPGHVQVGPTHRPTSCRSSGESAGPDASAPRNGTSDATLEAREADADKMARLRQRNRDAQARHRKRQREQCAGLMSRANSLQRRLAERETVKQNLKEQNAALTQRVSVAVATLSVTRDVIRTLPSNVPAAPVKPAQAVVTAPAPTPRLHAESLSIVPRPLNSYRHSAALALEHIQEASGSGGSTLDTSKRSSRIFTEQYKAQEAARCGCTPSEVCWFYQMHFEVATGVRLSVSTTLCTKECLSSMALNFLAYGLQMGLSAAMDSRVTDEEAQLFGVLKMPDYTGSGQRKRPIDGGPGLPDGYPGGHTASMAAAAAVAERDGSPSFLRGGQQLTCGVNRRCAVDLAAHKVLRDVVATFCGVLTQGVICRVCTATLEQINAMLCMFGSNSTPTLPQTAPYGAGSSRSAGSVGSAIHQGLTSAADVEYMQDMSDSSVVVLNAARCALESILHNLSAMIVAAQECTARLALEDRSMGEAAATAAILDAKMRHSGLSLSMLDACMFAEAGPVVCRMTMMAIQPLLSFHNMEALNVKIYKQLQLTRDQKAHFREFWDAWEYRKRAIDKPMQQVRAKLRNLPFGITLPVSFLNRISSLAGMSAHRRSNGWEPIGTTPLGAAPPVFASDGDDDGQTDRLRLLGMTAADTEAAAACVRELRSVHASDVEAFVDFKEVQVLPVSTLQTRQMVTMWSAHVLHKAAPHDFFGLARLASLELQRESLYRMQTYA